MNFPEPVIRVAIEPKTKAGQEKMGIALAKLAEEDPTFKFYTDEETGQTIIAGMGELHLEIIVDRMLREFKVEANVGKPQVAYKETVRKGPMSMLNTPASPVVKVSTVTLRSDCHPTRQARAMSSSTPLSAVLSPRNISLLLTPVSRALCRAVFLPDIPLLTSRLTLYDGSYHEVDSSEMAFKIAASMAFKEACKKADPVLMEPIMKVVVIVPEEYMGDVIGDLNSRRGEIQGFEDRSGGVKQINARVPLGDMFGYATDLRSKTQGRGQYVMEPDGYKEVPKSISEKIISARTKGE